MTAIIAQIGWPLTVIWLHPMGIRFVWSQPNWWN